MKMFYGSILCLLILACRTSLPPLPLLASKPIGTDPAQVSDPADWCAGHDLPESMCSKCNPSLIAGFKESGDWCAAHGFPESACPSCNPMSAPTAPARVADPADWCAGHDLPESMCSKCNPSLIAGFKESGDWCEAHGFPESACPSCNPMSAPTVPARVADPADWCAGHDLPESMCSKCNPSLIAGFKESGDWCEAHGFPESACPSCNPLAPPGEGLALADWCLEHGLPESKCSRCQPDLKAVFQGANDWCVEHGYPESVCPTCNPQTAPTGAEQAALEARVVRFRSPEIEAAAGIAYVSAKQVSASDTVDCTARIAFDEDRVADVRALVPGIVRKTHARLGDQVKAGQVLFELVSTRVGDLQAALTAARQRVDTAEANLARQRALAKRKIVADRRVEIAEQEMAAARAQGSAAETALSIAGASRGAATGHYNLVAPLQGVVTRRPGMVGLLATPDTSLATLVDTSVMWVYCDVPEADAARVATDQHVLVTVEGGGGSFHGRITWVSPEVDPRTRMVSCRAEVANPEGRLRANQYARAHIETGPPGRAVAVPRAALQRVGDRDLVFVRIAAGYYEPRVVTASDNGELVCIVGDVAVGDPVVTTGAFLLRTEIMPGSIGAGCCEVEPPARSTGER